MTPKAVCGPMFLMPEVRNIQVQAPRAVEKLEKAIHQGPSGYLQVPFAVPRRRHSWICGYVAPWGPIYLYSLIF